MRLALKTIFALFLIISPSMAEEISACQFHGIHSVFKSFNSSSAVFTGKVVAEKIVVGERIFRFEVKQAFKGLDISEVEINIGDENERCEGGFTIGESYLVYAYGKDVKSLHSYNFGSLNEILENANDQLHLIKNLLQGKPEPQIYGSVARIEFDKVKKQTKETNLQGIEILIEGKGKQFKSITNAEGIYYFNKIPKGEYIIKPKLSPIYKIYISEEEKFFVLKSGRITNDLFAELLNTTNKITKEENQVLKTHIQDGGYYEFLIELKDKVE